MNEYKIKVWIMFIVTLSVFAIAKRKEKAPRRLLEVDDYGFNFRESRERDLSRQRIEYLSKKRRLRLIAPQSFEN